MQTNREEFVIQLHNTGGIGGMWVSGIRRHYVCTDDKTQRDILGHRDE